MCVNLWLRSEHLGKLSGAAEDGASSSPHFTKEKTEVQGSEVLAIKLEGGDLGFKCWRIPRVGDMRPGRNITEMHGAVQSKRTGELN